MPSSSIHTWEVLSSKFLKKFFPTQKTRQMRKEIQSFQQRDGDLFFEAWELFETLSDHSQQFSSIGRQGVKSKGMYEVKPNGESPNHMATVDRKLDMIVKAMALQNISPSQ
jgi:hypothetical protein